MLEGSILYQLKMAHQLGPVGKRPLNFGVYYKNTLVALCHALEDSILECHTQPLVIAAFQRGKWYLQEADRYADLAARSRQVVIMAAPDAGFMEHPTSQKANVAVVSLAPDDPVAQEWHLIIVSPDYTAMVLCQELSAADYQVTGMPNHDQERRFYGFWTFEPTLVQETAELAIAHIERYNPNLHQQLSAKMQAIREHSHQQGVLCGGLPHANHLGEIVSRVVDYLQTSQQGLDQIAPAYTPQYTGLDNNLVSNELQAFLRIAQLIDQTDISNPMAAAEVATLAESLGQLLDLPSWQLHRLRLAGLLHRIALMPHLETELTPGTTPRYEESPSLPLTCPLIPGTQVLRRMNRLKAIATILNHQTEWWNGSGQPAGLAGDEIPLESRILGLVAHFQHYLATHTHSSSHSPFHTPELLTEALAHCEAQQGTRWDPKLVEVLALLVNGLRQGLDLPVILPKIAAGLWLIDSHSDDELYAEQISSSIAGSD